MEKITITMVGYYAGKTSFMHRFFDNSFDENMLCSIGCENQKKNLKLPNGNEINLILYDTAGNERFFGVSEGVLRRADGGFLMYDITQRYSFETVSRWIDVIKEINIPAILIGNRCDLEYRREISKEEGEKLSEENGFHFYETSCKYNINIEEPIYDLVEQILKKREEKKVNQKNIKQKNIKKEKNKNNIKEVKKELVPNNNVDKKISKKQNEFKIENKYLNIYFKYLNY